MEPNAYIPENRFRALTAIIVFCSLLVGLVIPSVELVIGLVGSTIGIAICIVFPACCFTKVSKKESTEKLLAKLMIVCGVCLMVLGTYANLSAIDDKATAAAAAIHVPEPVVVLPELNKFNNNENAPLLTGKLDPEDLSKLHYKVDAEKEKLINAEIEARILIDKLEKELEKKPKIETMPVAAEQKAKETEPKNPLNNDAIKKEEEEELTADKDANVVVQEELSAVVDEIKRQNEESQKRVLEKLEEIVEKIEQKLDPAVAAEPRPIDKNVVNQVRDKFPDPIPLRGQSNGAVDEPQPKEVGQTIEESKKDEAERRDSEVNLNLDNKTKDEVIVEAGNGKIEETYAKDIKSEPVEVKEVEKPKPVEAEIDKKIEVQKVEDNKEELKVAAEDQVKAKEETAKKPDPEDADAIRRDLLNVDNESLARFKRNADCEREI